MTFKELSESKERDGAALFSIGDVVYIHPEISMSMRYPTVTEGMARLGGIRCEIKEADTEAYSLVCADSDLIKQSIWKKYCGSTYMWSDWILIGEKELLPDVPEQDFMNML